MTQQYLDLALSVINVLKDNWNLEDDLDEHKIKWYSYVPTAIEIRENKLSISVVFTEGSGTTTSKAITQMKDILKIDIFLALHNLEGSDRRAKGELERMLIKDKVVQLIHDKQILISGVKFGKYTRSARSDEVDSADEKWFLHETIYIQCEWYQTKT